MIPLADVLAITGLVVGVGGGLAAGGWLLLRALRGRSLATMLAVVAAVTVASTLAGVLVTALAMFLSPHDRTVVLVLVVVSGLMGWAVALFLGRSVTSASRALGEAVRWLPERGVYTSPDVSLPAELDRISRELASAHTRLQDAREHERAMEASRRELVAWISHDLRTPLAGLRAMAEALEDGVAAGPEVVGGYHAQIRREVDRLADMVDDLFELARINAGALRLSREQVDVDDLVAEVVASSVPLAEARGVRLSGSACPGLPVDVDTAELGRALRNLVVNAIRHTPNDASVEVSGAAADGMACVTVSDACGGIPEDRMPALFDAAHHGDTGTTAGPGQSGGLGLAIARGIVQAHAGDIDVANAGVGCRFVVRLPLAAKAAG